MCIIIIFFTIILNFVYFVDKELESNDFWLSQAYVSLARSAYDLY